MTENENGKKKQAEKDKKNMHAEGQSAYPS